MVFLFRRFARRVTQKARIGRTNIAASFPRSAIAPLGENFPTHVFARFRGTLCNPKFSVCGTPHFFWDRPPNGSMKNEISPLAAYRQSIADKPVRRLARPGVLPCHAEWPYPQRVGRDRNRYKKQERPRKSRTNAPVFSLFRRICGRLAHSDKTNAAASASSAASASAEPSPSSSATSGATPCPWICRPFGET